MLPADRVEFVPLFTVAHGHVCDLIRVIDSSADRSSLERLARANTVDLLYAVGRERNSGSMTVRFDPRFGIINR